MKFGFNWEPDLNAVMQAHEREGARVVTRAMKGAGGDLKGRWRSQITGSGLGRRLAGTIRSKSYPGSADSLNAAAVVWSKAPHIVSAHNSGAVIRSKDGPWLTIPTEAAGRGSGRSRLTPADWERRTGMRLRLVYRPGRTSLLVADDARLTKRGLARQKKGRRRKDGILTGAQTVVVFILVPQVRLKKRLDLGRAAQDVAGSIPGRIDALWRD